MTARKTGNGEERVYAAAEEWVNRALRAEDSLFTPGRAIWSVHWLNELHAAYNQEANPALGGFYGRLQGLLAGSSPEVNQLMAEVLYFQYLIHHGMKEAEQLKRIRSVFEWSGQRLEVPNHLAVGLTPGIAKVGGQYSRGLTHYVGYIIEFVKRWKELDLDDQHSLLNDPWAFKDFSHASNLYRNLFVGNFYLVQRNALLHLVFPDIFEPIVSADHKNILVERLAKPFESRHADVDRNIQEIRTDLENELGRDFDFYEGDIYDRWRGNTPAQVQHPLPQPSNTLQSLAAQTYLPSDFLEEIAQLLQEKKQVIFQGPPGTGKTYIARVLARALAGKGENLVELVQFHPSYAYEDFVQGFRPTLVNGQPGFELRDGPLRRMAERARSDESNNYYLIIDEINRGNLAKVFGELYFLLEYRHEEMILQYSSESFSLPKNLYIIGTMNTADRSIALVDLALRRRFYFVDFQPNEEPIQSVLREYLKEEASGMEWVADVVDEVNRRLNDTQAAIGPSYFMKPGLTEADVELRWKHSILPYIEERLFGASERLAEFDLAALRMVVNGSEVDQPPTDDADAGDGN